MSFEVGERESIGFEPDVQRQPMHTRKQNGPNEMFRDK